MSREDQRNQIIRVQQFLREGWQNKSHPDGFWIRRHEIEALGSDPDAAAKTFVKLKGHAWDGEYVDSQERDWAGAWVRWVR